MARLGGPRAFSARGTPDPVPTHSHESEAEGGRLGRYVHPDAANTFTQPQDFGTVTADAVTTEDLTVTGDLSLRDLSSWDFRVGVTVHEFKTPNDDGLGHDWYLPSSSCSLGGAVSAPIGSGVERTAAVTPAVNLYASAPAGLYRVNAYAVVTTAAAAGTLDVRIGWTDELGATTEDVINDLSLTGTGRAAATKVFRHSSGNITYEIPIAGLSGIPGFYLNVLLERLA